MKKLDKLVLQSFVGPFILTFLVVVFILLMVQMLKYFDDIIGKDLGASVISQLLFYFAVFTTPTALPLAVLLASLITYGNLGEHFELTAIKSAGISLVRTLQPIFIFVVFLTLAAFYINNNLVPKAALQAYSLLYDIKQKKPALDLREGTFYNGIPDISIKVDQKFPEDESALKGIVVYDHRRTDGNRDVIKADSGRMYTILNERYLKFELYNGYNYREGAVEEQGATGQKRKKQTNESLTRSKFEKTQIVFDLSSFALQRTDPKWFQSNRIMRNLAQLDEDIDSIENDILMHMLGYYEYRPTFFSFFMKGEEVILPDKVVAFRLYRDSLERSKYLGQTLDSTRTDSVKTGPTIKPRFTPADYNRAFAIKKQKLEKKRLAARERVIYRDSLTEQLDDTTAAVNYAAIIDSLFWEPPTREVVQGAANMARQTKTTVASNNASIDYREQEKRVFKIQWHRILASSVACIAMFLIGAPLGAIIKKGGLGVPFLVSIFFFIIFYVISMQGEKLAKQDVVSVSFGVWIADVVLFVVGLVFLRQARADARLLEADAYRVTFDRIRSWLEKKRVITAKAGT